MRMGGAAGVSAVANGVKGLVSAPAHIQWVGSYLKPTSHNNTVLPPLLS